MYIFGGTVDNNVRSSELYRFQVTMFQESFWFITSNNRSIYMMLIREINSLELRMETIVYDPRSF